MVAGVRHIPLLQAGNLARERSRPDGVRGYIARLCCGSIAERAGVALGNALALRSSNTRRTKCPTRTISAALSAGAEDGCLQEISLASARWTDMTSRSCSGGWSELRRPSTIRHISWFTETGRQDPFNLANHSWSSRLARLSVFEWRHDFRDGVTGVLGSPTHRTNGRGTEREYRGSFSTHH